MEIVTQNVIEERLRDRISITDGFVVRTLWNACCERLEESGEDFDTAAVPKGINGLPD